MNDIEDLKLRRRTLDAEFVNLTIKAREAKKAICKAKTYAEELTLRVILAKAEYDLAMCGAEVYDNQFNISLFEGEK